MKRLFRLLSIAFGVLFVSIVVLLFFMPKPTLLEGMSFSTMIDDDTHHLLRLTLNQDDKYRVFVPLSAISPTLVETTLLKEDHYFHQHYGINPIAMFKAVWQTYVLHGRRLGASTLTMQVARLRFGLYSKTVKGKLMQIMRAIQLERYYSKSAILEAYFNLVPYGHNIEGVGAASLIYFNQQASEVTLPEALALSVIPQHPAKRTPNQNNDVLRDSRQTLFAHWLALHPTDRDKQSLMDLPLQMRSLSQLPYRAPHAVNRLLKVDQARSQSIGASINLSLQTVLERVIRRYIQQHQRLGVSNAAVMLVDARNMEVKAAVGSVDFFNRTIQGQMNGTDMKRSPGSTLKPFIYGLALDQGLIHPNTVLKDVPHRFGAYNPENFDGDFLGPVTAKDALVFSRNIPAIDLANQLKHPDLYTLLEQAQVSRLRPASFYGLSLALGGAELSMRELVSLYAMLVNDGVWRPLRDRVDDPISSGRQLLSPEASFLVLEMLKETPKPAVASSIQTPVSWKTGTSSGYRDAWTVGNAGPYVLAVWIGHFNRQSNPAFVGKEIAAPLWFELLEAIQREKGTLPVLEKHPERLNLTRIAVCKASGMLPTRFCPDTVETWFIPGKSPIKSDTVFREVAIDPKTGWRTCHIDEHTRFEIDEFWSTDLLAIFKQAGIKRHTPPPYMPGCAISAFAASSPLITSPQSSLEYVVSQHSASEKRIPFTAVVDADVKTIYWFLNHTYLGQSKPQDPLLWPAKVGRYVVRVVDDHGLADAHDLVVR